MTICFTTIDELCKFRESQVIKIVQTPSVSMYYPPVLETMADGQIDASTWQDLCSPIVCKSASEYISVLDNVYITPTGLIVTRTGHVLRESMTPFDIENCPTSVIEQLQLCGNGLADLSHESYVNAEKVDTAIFGREIGEAGYYHLITSLVPRILRAKKALEPDGDRAPILFERWVPQMEEAAALFGFADQIMTYNGRYIHVERLIFPSPTQSDDSHYTRPRNIFSAYDKFLNAGEVPNENLFVSRMDAGTRRLINEKDITQCLSNCHVTRNSELSLADQVTMFSGAKLVAGAHGAGLTNIIFMRPGGCVVELMSPNRIWPSYRVICANRGLRYIPVIGKLCKGTEDFIIEVEVAARTISSLIDDQYLRSRYGGTNRVQ